MHRLLRVWILLSGLSIASSLEAQTTQPTAYAGNSISAVLASNQQDLSATLASQTGISADTLASSPLSSYQQIYSDPKNGGCPTLASMGITLAPIVNDPGFNTLYWSVVILAGTAAAVRGFGRLRNGGGKEAFDELVNFFLKLAAGVLFVAGSGYIYATAMTVRDGFVLAVAQTGSQSAMQQVLAKADLSNFNYQAVQVAARDDAIRDRIGMTQAFSNDTDLATMAQIMNDLATAVNSATGIPSTGATTAPSATAPSSSETTATGQQDGLLAVPTSTSLPSAPASNGSSSITNSGDAKATMAQQFRAAFTDILSMSTPDSVSVDGASIPTAGAGAQSAATPMVQAMQAAQAIPQTSATQLYYRGALQAYEDAAKHYYKNALDNALTPLSQASPSGGGTNPMAAMMTTKGISRLEAASGSAPPQGESKFVKFLMDAVNDGMGYVIAHFVNWVVNIVIEGTIILMIMVMPLWLFPATEKAFSGCFKILFNAVLYLPFFQVMAFILDMMTANMLASIVPSTWTGTALTLLVPGAAAATAIGSGMIICMYIFCLIVLIFLTPKLIGSVFSGAGIVGGFLHGLASAGVASAMTAAKIGVATATGGAGAAAAVAVGLPMGAIRSGAAAAGGASAAAATSQPPAATYGAPPPPASAPNVTPPQPAAASAAGAPAPSTSNSAFGSAVAGAANRGLSGAAVAPAATPVTNSAKPTP